MSLKLKCSYRVNSKSSQRRKFVEDTTMASTDKQEPLLPDNSKNDTIVDITSSIDLMKFAGEVDVPSDVSDNESEFIGIGDTSSDDEDEDLEDNESERNAKQLLGIPASKKNTLSSTDYVSTQTGTTIATTTTVTTNKTAKRQNINPMIKEFRRIFKISFLIAMQLIFEFGSEIIGNIMVGHYYDSTKTDDEYISAIGLATMFVDLTGDTIVWGLTSGLHTLVPQALGHPSKIIQNLCLRIYCQRAFVMTTIFGTLCNILPFFAGKIMILIGQPIYL